MSVAGFQDRPKRQTGMGGFSGGSGYWENRGQRNWWAEPTLPGSFACVVIVILPKVKDACGERSNPRAVGHHPISKCLSGPRPDGAYATPIGCAYR
jgi:hypothetical protein